MQPPASVLVCFAVEDEACYLRKNLPPVNPCKILITGIGRRNSERTFRAALTTSRPSLVLSSGFAGGLDPDLETGAILFEAAPESLLSASLLAFGARPGRFHCADQIAATADAKRKLRESSGADAVEMESGIIRGICAQGNIPAVTIRVISDSAQEDLPLDFNHLMTADQRLNYVKLAWHLAKSPGTVAKLLVFRRTIAACARNLAAALNHALQGFRSE